MLEKNPNERMPIDDILALPIIINNAQKHLPKNIFKAEFTDYAAKNQLKIDDQKKEIVPMKKGGSLDCYQVIEFINQDRFGHYRKVKCKVTGDIYCMKVSISYNSTEPR